MTDESSKNFREYATRVSFNISLSRNQIAVLRSVRLEQSLPIRREWHDHGPTGMERGRTEYEDHRGDSRNLFVPGVRPLIGMGLIVWRDPALMVPKWSEHAYRLTEIGEIMCRLLEKAGLIPTLAVANENKTKVTRKKRA